MRPEEIEKLIAISNQVDFSRQRADRYMIRMKRAELELKYVKSIIDAVLEEAFKYTDVISIPPDFKPKTVQHYKLTRAEGETIIITKKSDEEQPDETPEQT